MTCTAVRQPSSPLHSAYSPVSKLDARKKPKSGRLHRGGSAVQRGRTRRIERGIPCVRRAAASSVTEIHGSFALERAFEVPWIVTVVRRQPTETSGDVRARKSVRYSRDLKGETSFRKMGLPLAMTSLLGGRVPLGPRESIEHPGTLGTACDVRAPGAHDGASGFEKVRPLIGPRNLGANHV